MTKLVNRAKMLTNTTGTGTLTLTNAVSGFQSFAEAGVVNGDAVRYVIEDGHEWEIGLGTYTSSGTTLTRNVSESSNNGAAINLTGNAVVYLSITNEDVQTDVEITGGTIDGVEHVGLDTSLNKVPLQGQFTWDDDNETVKLGLNGSTLSLGQEVHYHVRNNTGITIPKGTAVRASGTIGMSGRITVAPMIADGSIPAKFFIGITREEIPNDADGKVTHFGKIRELDTNAFDEGDVLWVSPTTAGALTNVEPTGSNLKLPVAFVVSKSATVGAIMVRTTVSATVEQGQKADSAVQPGSSPTLATVTLTGDLVIPDRIIHAGDTDTQIRFPANDVMSVETNGAERMRINSAGNVGIGTSSPTGPLDVVGRIASSTTDPTAIVGIRTVFSGTQYTTIGDNLNIGLSEFFSGVNPVRVRSPEDIRFQAGGTNERLRITSAGNVGIGTSSPDSALHVNSSSAEPVVISRNGGTDANTVIRWKQATTSWYAGASSNNAFALKFVNANLDDSPLVSITSAGNVGIGKSSPAVRLHAETSGAGLGTVARVSRVNGAENHGINFNVNPDTKVSEIRAFGSTNGALSFATNNTERLRIDSAGNVGIGTNSPRQTLDIAGNTVTTGWLTVGHERFPTPLSSPLGVAAGAGAGIGSYRFSANSFGNDIKLAKSRSGTIGVNTIVQNGDTLANIDFRGADGDSGYPIAVRITGSVDGTPSTTSMPGRLVFSTTPSGSTTLTERMRIDSAGNVGIGTSSPAVPLQVNHPFAANITYTPNAATVATFSRAGFASIVVTAGTSHESAIRFGSVNVEDLGGIIYRTNEDSMRLRTAGTERMRIDSAGNVGIGTSSPAERLTVATGMSEFAIQFGGPGKDWVFGSASNRMYLRNKTDGVEALTILNGGNVGIGTNSPSERLSVSGNVTITGSLSKGSGSFKIDHPIKPKTHHLVHSFIEGPQADNIYRGKVALVEGTATINLDEAGRMTEGTFVALNGNVQCFTTNESGWTAVRGKVKGNILTIEAQDSACTDTVSWLVIGERHDSHMIEADWTDSNGRIITEPKKEVTL